MNFASGSRQFVGPEALRHKLIKIKIQGYFDFDFNALGKFFLFFSENVCRPVFIYSILRLSESKTHFNLIYSLIAVSEKRKMRVRLLIYLQ